MARLIQFPPFRLCSMLCIALTLVFAGVGMTSIVDRFQHQNDVSADHEHLPLSIIASDMSDHGDGHSDTTNPDDAGSVPNHQSGAGHHHHGDAGSSLPALGSQGDSGLFQASLSQPLTADDRLPDILIYGPERPPKNIANRI
ncbi:hypothetical protein [Sphingobium abikonense]|uniref:hypothetical protein n=1 Tax=Sphingomonadales TaxID=204457 RepID=UPI0012E3CB5F|nr:hypothetical protein [Pseudomonadota bacterium]